MRTFRTLLMLCLITVVSGVSVAGDSDENLMKEVAALGDALSKAMLADDVPYMLSMYADDAISLPNYSPRLQGAEAFKQHHADMAAAGMKIHAFSSDPTDVWSCGSHVIEVGTYEIELTMPGVPQAIKDKGKYMTFYERDSDGVLRIKVETWNTDVNPMEMGGPG